MKYICLLICCTVICLAGCAQSQKSEFVKEVYLTGVNKQQAIEISEDVLREFSFSIAKEDVNEGIIKTRPLVGGQFFEFWRKDNACLYETVESSIHSIRRTAELNINDTGDKLVVNCEIKVQRLHLPQSYEQTAGYKYDRITGRRIRTTALSLDLGEQQTAWIDLGNDEKLSAAIVSKIEALVK